ncbi:DsbA family protein [Primorskyibacter aestuariivivens]|uniref:DsbA family protein n=1 Tax=Primorskyibacter aestuariivivens TaxID=1888912 RepID=UPI002301B368|nr:DsbA family protein [Primorskyibacter aestuariivivens]MDA7428619.1 DsbA family protein [Primorskyibacter aestuariivivens]
MTQFLKYATLASTLALATPALATDLTEMSDAEREAFRAEVRAYLLDNPEVIMEAVQVLEERQQAAQEGMDVALVQANRDDIFNDGFSHVGGNPDGDITMVEFVDYRCGYCRKAHDEVHELINTDGNIRFITKEFPILGPESLESSKFAIAVRNVAGDDAYVAANDTLIRYNGKITEGSLRKLAMGLGVDADAVLAEMESDAVARVISETRALAQRLQINGTPTFVLEDEMIRGYVPLEGMRQFVDQVRDAG